MFSNLYKVPCSPLSLKSYIFELKVKSSLFYRNIQNAQKESAKDIQSPSRPYYGNNNKRNLR